MNLTYSKPGDLCLIQQLETGRIVQVAVTVKQSKQLQSFLAILSQTHPLVQMGEEHDLVLKANLCKRCKTK